MAGVARSGLERCLAALPGGVDAHPAARVKGAMARSALDRQAAALEVARAPAQDVTLLGAEAGRARFLARG